MTQMDLFEWAASRSQTVRKRPGVIRAERLEAARRLSSAEIIDWIPHLAKRMWAERHQSIPPREAVIMPMAPRDTEIRRTA